jgi:hypothetical protein
VAWQQQQANTPAVNLSPICTETAVCLAADRLENHMCLVALPQFVVQVTTIMAMDKLASMPRMPPTSRQQQRPAQLPTQVHS